MRLRVGHQQWQFCPILARFMDYNALFWGHRVISTINEPCGAFTCRSSTLAVWPILARFVDYYSLFWGPGVISTIDEPRGAFMCRSSIILFFPILGSCMDYSSRFWGPGVISTINEPCGAFRCRSPTLTVLADSGPFLGLLLTILGSRSNFHSC